MLAAHDDLWDCNFLQCAISALHEGHSVLAFDWFIGSLERYLGVRPHMHSLRHVERRDSPKRTVSLLYQHPSSRECNLAYADYRSEFLQSVRGAGSMANDGLVTARVANANFGYARDAILFLKKDRFASPSHGYQQGQRLLGRFRLLPQEKFSRPFEAAKARGLDEVTKVVHQ